MMEFDASVSCDGRLGGGGRKTEGEEKDSRKRFVSRDPRRGHRERDIVGVGRKRQRDRRGGGVTDRLLTVRGRFGGVGGGVLRENNDTAGGVY